MKISEVFNYYGPNRRSELTAMEFRVALSKAELTHFRDHADELYDHIVHELRKSGLDDRALSPLLESFPENPGEQFSFLCAGIAIALQRAAGHRVDYHKCLPESVPGHFAVVFEHETSKVGIPAGQLAIDLLVQAMPTLKRPENWPTGADGFKESLPGFLETARGLVLPIDAQAIIDAAARQDIPVVKLDRDPYTGVSGKYRVRPNGMLQLGHACHKRILDGTFCIERKDLARLLTDRAHVNECIQKLGLTAPRRDAPRHLTSSRAARAARRIGFPVAVKSLSRGPEGRVSLDIRDDAALRAVTDKVRAGGEGVVVEQFVSGDTTRILVAGFKVIDALTSGRSNLPQVDSTILEAASTTARQLDAGILLMTVVSPDIGQSLPDAGGAVVDLDIAPMLDGIEGLSNSAMSKVAGQFLRWLFPPGTSSRIPLVAITGTNGKTTTSRMISAAAQASGFYPGMAGSLGVVINGVTARLADKAGTVGHRRILESDKVDFGVLETARGGITHTGFMFDHCNVAVCGNVTEDHLGQYGIETVEDMVVAKRRVLERATDAVIINIDDPGCSQMLPFEPGPRLGLVSLVLDASQARERAGDEHAVFAGLEIRDGEESVVIDDAGERTILMPVSDIPATYQGQVRYNVYNALHAILASYQMDLPMEAVAKALSRFDTSYENLPGRLNIYDGLPFRVILNFMTSPDAMYRSCEFINNLEVDGRRIILLVSFGNKSNQHTRDLVLTSLDYFDIWCLRDYTDLRGREAGEVPALMKSTLMSAGVPESHIHVLEDGSRALEQALEMCEAGDLVVISAGVLDIEDSWQRIKAFKQL